MEQQIDHIGGGENADFVEIVGGENADFMEIAGSDQVKMRRLTEIRSWFHNTRQMHSTAWATMTQMTRREKAKLSPPPAQPMHMVEILLWAMEQADSSSPWTRRRWWAFRFKVEHPLDQGHTVHEVPLQIVEPPTESEMTPKRKTRRTVIAISLPRKRMKINIRRKTIDPCKKGRKEIEPDAWKLLNPHAAIYSI